MKFQAILLKNMVHSTQIAQLKSERHQVRKVMTRVYIIQAVCMYNMMDMLSVMAMYGLVGLVAVVNVVGWQAVS